MSKILEFSKNRKSQNKCFRKRKVLGWSDCRWFLIQPTFVVVCIGKGRHHPWNGLHVLKYLQTTTNLSVICTSWTWLYTIRQPAKSRLIPERTLTILNMVLPPYHKIGSSTHTLHFEITFDFVDNHACIMPVHFF